MVNRGGKVVKCAFQGDGDRSCSAKCAAFGVSETHTKGQGYACWCNRGDFVMGFLKEKEN